MRDEGFLRKLSGINNLKGISLSRFIIGLVLVFYGFGIFFLNSIGDIWLRISLATAFWGLGLMFILEGQSILREHFYNKQEKSVVANKIKEADPNRAKINLLGVYLLSILGLFIFLGVKFYLNQPEDKLILSLIIIACSGGIGGTLYAIRGFYQSLAKGIFNFDNWAWWYIFRPLMSAVIGVFVSFLIIGGILVIGSGGLNYSRGLMFYSAIAFLAGFSFTQFANKLEEIASTIFAKKEDKKK